jgi:exopolysaccharide biosynthesis protein
MAIPKGKIVLSGHGTANTYLTNNLKIGEEVEVTVNYTLQHAPEVNADVIRNAVASVNLILKDNDLVEPGTNALFTANEPRTAVGYSAQKDFVYFVVVDGRSAASTGVSTKELGQVMQYLGATDAINLDGGGSSCLMVGKDTKNVPSDGSQRAVCNGLAIIKK